MLILVIDENFAGVCLVLVHIDRSGLGRLLDRRVLVVVSKGVTRNRVLKGRILDSIRRLSHDSLTSVREG